MRGFTFLLISLITSVYCFSQVSTNELLDQIKNAKVDTTKVNLYNDLATNLFRKEPDSAIFYAQKGIDLAEQIDFKTGLGYAYKNVGLGYWVKGEYKEVVRYWEKSLEIFKSIDFTLGISNLQSNLGAVYQTKGDDPTALEFFINSMRNATKIQDTLRIATAYLNMGTVYSNEKNNYPQSKESYEKALELFKAIDEKEGIALSTLNLGELLLREDKPNEALPYLEESIQTKKEIEGNLSVNYNLIGEAYTDLGELNKAEDNLLRSIEFAENRDSKMEKTMALNRLARVYYLKDNFEESIKSYNEALELTKTTEVYRDREDAYDGLADVYYAMGDFKKAYDYQERTSVVRDTIRDEQYEKTLGDLRFEFDVENKEREIALLNTANELNEAQIEQEATSRKLLYALLAFLTSIIVGFFLQYRYVQKAHKRLNIERNRSESILLNILPKETAEELKTNGFIKAKKFESVTVLFTDFKAFSLAAENVAPEILVKSVDFYFKKFDEIIEKHNLEKIKTIGDAYMCAGGLPSKNNTHPEDALNAAVEIMDFVNKTSKDTPKDIMPFQLRIGINTGQVVAGVVGTKKFQYDIWGNTVNIAARMESSSFPGRINVSENTYELLKNKHQFEYRGIMEVKNGRKLKMYYLNQKGVQS